MPLSAKSEGAFPDSVANVQPWTVQPHGLLIVASASGSAIRHLAGAVESVVDCLPGSLPGRSLHSVFGSVADEWLALAGINQRPGFVGLWYASTIAQPCAVLGHRCGDQVLLEFEPAPMRKNPAEAIERLGHAVDAMDASPDMPHLCTAAAREMRRLTGFERVVVVRIPAAGAPVVLAEDKLDELPSLLGRRRRGEPRFWPATAAAAPDHVEMIPDTLYGPVPLAPEMSGENATTLDACVLRGAAPAQLAQLVNMGVGASIAVPVISEGEPWGILVGHHRRAMHLGYDLREGCRLLGRTFARAVRVLDDDTRRRSAGNAAAARKRALDRVRRALADDTTTHLDAATLQAMIPADGVAVVSRDRIDQLGQTPPAEQLRRLAGWLAPRAVDSIYATERLADGFTARRRTCHGGGGLLATVTRGEWPVVALWFRQVVAGPVRPASSRRSARKTGWSEENIDVARQLARALDAALQHRTLQDLNARLRHALSEQQALVAQKQLLMQEVHHRTQNGLQIVNAMLQLQARRARDPAVRAQFDDAVGRLMAVSSVHRHLWRSSDMQNVQLDAYLKQLCADLTLSWGAPWTHRLSLSSATVSVASHIAATLGLIVTELLTNAVKYAYAGEPGPIELALNACADGTLQVTVRDHGCGMAEAKGSGLGSELIRTFTQQLGGTARTSSSAAGTTVTLRIPLEREPDTADRDNPAQPATYRATGPQSGE